MGLFIDDSDACKKCGAYWTSTGHCCNGHPRPEKLARKSKEAVLRLYVDGDHVYEKRGGVRGEIKLTINNKPLLRAFYLPKDV